MTKPPLGTDTEADAETGTDTEAGKGWDVLGLTRATLPT